MRRRTLHKVVMGTNGAQPVGSSQPTRPGVVLMPRRDAGQASKPGVVFLPKSQGGAAAAAAVSRSTPARAVVAPPPGLSPDQLLLCRHLVNAHMIAKGDGNEADFAKVTIEAIDASLAAIMAQPVPPPVVVTVPKSVVVTANRSQGLGAIAPRGVPSAQPAPAPAAPVVDVPSDAEINEGAIGAGG